MVKASTAGRRAGSSRGSTSSPPGRAKTAPSNGPPDNYQDYADFVSAFVNRYGRGLDRRPRRRPSRSGTKSTSTASGAARRSTSSKPPTTCGCSAWRYQAAKAADPSVTGHHRRPLADGRHRRPLRGRRPVPAVAVRRRPARASTTCSARTATPRRPKSTPPSARCPDFPHPSFYFRRVEQLRDVMVKNGDADKQIWLLEFGWTADTVHPNYAWFAVSEDKKAANILKAFQYARTELAAVDRRHDAVDAARSDAGRPTARSTGGRSPTPTARPRAAYSGLLQARRGGALAGLSPGT